MGVRFEKVYGLLFQSRWESGRGKKIVSRVQVEQEGARVIDSIEKARNDVTTFVSVCLVPLYVADIND